MASTVNLQYERVTCPVCGSKTAEEAETRCRTYSDETGEHYCKGGMEREDAEGFFIDLTPETMAALAEEERKQFEADWMGALAPNLE